jgi:GNAT superfamily N-acetyltransferase
MTSLAADALAWRIEEAEFNAFPSVRQVLLGGWVLRFSEGGPRRGANSASPLRADCDDGDALIDAVEPLYRRRGLAPLFRIPTLIPDALETRLAARGYTSEGESCTLYGPISGIATVSDSEVQLTAAPTPPWLAAMAALQRRTPEQSEVYRRIVRAIALPARFATLSIDGEPAALAYAAIHDRLLCYESVVTDPARRRQGLARRVIAALAVWGRNNGAEAACLQVEAGNAPAIALYDRFGLTREVSRYHYRRAPD